MLKDGIKALLLMDNTIAAQVSTRVYDTVLPRGYVLPSIVQHQYGLSQEYEFSGPVDNPEDQLQLDIYGKAVEDHAALVQAVRNVLSGFTGALPDGTSVQGCFLTRQMDMPYLPGADQTGQAFRTVLAFRIVNKKV